MGVGGSKYRTTKSPRVSTRFVVTGHLSDSSTCVDQICLYWSPFGHAVEESGRKVNPEGSFTVPAVLRPFFAPFSEKRERFLTFN